MDWSNSGDNVSPLFCCDAIKTLCPLTCGKSGLDAAKITQETWIPYEVGTYLGTKVLPLALSAFLKTDHQC